MKKVLFLVAILGLGALNLRAENYSLNAMAPAPPHVEFKYYGFYASLDYTMMMNLNKVEFDIGGQHTVDSYLLNGVTAVAGFQWRKESAVGVGFSYLSDPNGSFSQIPLFLEYRTYFLRSRLTPFTTLQLGYSLPFGSVNPGADYIKINQGGITAGVTAGGRVAISRRFGMDLWVGYQLIQIRELERGFATEPATCLPELYHNLKAGVGLNF